MLFVLLFLGLVASVFLITQPQFFKPKAAPSTTLDLSFQSTTTTIKTYDTFDLNININTNGNQIIGAELYISFDKTKLEALEATLGTFLTGAYVIEKNLDNQNGKVTFKLLIPVDKTPKSGPGTLALLRFRARSAGTTTVNFSSETLIAAVNEGAQNVLKTTTPINFTILPSGDPTKKVFVTSTTHSGNLGGLTGADSFCQARAGGLGGTWKAWLSSSTQTTASRITYSTAPYKLLNGVTVANNFTDLTDGTLLAPINVTEQKTTVSSPLVWTNTAANGTLPNTNKSCRDWQDRGDSIEGNNGSSISKTATWTNNNKESCDRNLRLYCIEQ